MLLPAVNQAVEEGAGGDHHCACQNLPAVSQAHAAHRPILVENQIHHFRLLDVEIRLRLQHLAHLHPVLPFIALRSRRPHRRPARRIQQPELDAHRVGDLAHNPAQRIYFSNQVSFGDAPNGRVADICAIRSRLKLNSAVRRPIRAEAIAASHPACPAPTTTMSYCSVNAMTALF